ncbi:nitrate transporter 1:2 [Actinidia rufa]|uniref:Nitrate transporter 1:2 n=1 Tax=Actinidia rufa TaxID=165716 RepID=A0A7J0DTE7_9ERIC|nr:nitrate transporter 1:2 [Actinidia rufa]
MIVQANIGRILSTILTSSTCCGEQWSDLWTSLLTTALFRNLRLSVFGGLNVFYGLGVCFVILYSDWGWRTRACGRARDGIACTSSTSA